MILLEVASALCTFVTVPGTTFPAKPASPWIASAHPTGAAMRRLGGRAHAPEVFLDAGVSAREPLVLQDLEDALRGVSG